MENLSLEELERRLRMELRDREVNAQLENSEQMLAFIDLNIRFLIEEIERRAA